MPAVAHEAGGPGAPELMTWDELRRLPEDIAAEIELWDRRVVWNRRGPLEHQRFAVRMRNALESEARRAMRARSGDDAEIHCWQVEVATDMFLTDDKSSYLTPDFLVRRYLPRGFDTAAADVVLVGEVLSGSDAPKRREWKKDQYAEAGIHWYWELELDSGDSWDVAAVRAYELLQVGTAGLTVKPLRSAVYVLAGEWEPGDPGIDFPAPFEVRIAWDELSF